MSTQLFGPPNAGGSFADKLRQAQDFMNGARGKATVADVATEPVTHGLAADVAPGAAAPTGVDAAVPVTTAAGHDADGLAAAARAAAEQSIADPAYHAAAQQQVEFIVQPRVMVQGQAGPVIVPVDIAIPAAQTNVTVAPAQAVVLDAATGQVVPAPGAAAAAAAPAADVAAPATRGFRSWGIEDLGALGRGRGAAPAAAPAAGAPAAAAATTVAAEAPAAAGGGGWKAQVENMLLQGRSAAVADAAPAPAAAAAGGDWRSKVEDMLGLAKAPGAAAPVAVVADAPAAAAAATKGDWRAGVENLLGLAKAGGAAPAAAEVAAGAPRQGLLSTIRENTAGIGALLSRSAPDAAPVVDDVAKAAKPGLRAALNAAVEAAKVAR